MLHSIRYHSTGHFIVELVKWPALIYLGIMFLIHVAAVGQYIESISSSVTLARLAIYADFLGPFSVFLAVLFWDTMRTGGVWSVRIFSSVGYILGPYALITILALTFNFHPTSYWGEHGESRLLPLFPLFSFLFLCFGVSFAAIPSIARHYRYLLVLCIACIFFSELLDFFSLGELSVYGGRAAGLAANPNVTAQILIALCVATVNWRKASLLNGVIWLIVGVGVLITLSRGGLLEYVFALSIYLAVTMRVQARILLSRVALLALIVVFILVFGLASITPVLESNEMFKTPTAQAKFTQLHALLVGDFASVASDDRAGVVYDYIDQIAQSPWTGYGTGSVASQTVGPHNIYLQQWVENGILGLALFLVFLSASFWHFKRYKDVRGMTYVTTCFIAGFFSHNLLGTQPFMFLFGFLGALAYVEYSGPIVARPSMPEARRTRLSRTPR